MANTSIFAAFERMWQHIVTRINEVKPPTVTSEDNGKFLRVVNGEWVATTVPNAEDGEF